MMHGHTKIELTNVHTGEVEVVEKDNIVTNAVSRIFQDYGGRLNLHKLMIQGETTTDSKHSDLASASLLEFFYGGLLLYDAALGSDANTFFAPASAHLVGSAVSGQVNTGENTTRGSCNKTETNIDLDEGVATFVYDFSTSQGNGIISSVCLTSLMGGFYSEAKTATPKNIGTAQNPTFGQDYYGIWTGNTPQYQDYTAYLRPDVRAIYAPGKLLYLDTEQDILVFAQILTGKKLALKSYRAYTKEVNLFRPFGYKAASVEPDFIFSQELDVSTIIQNENGDSFSGVNGANRAYGEFNRLTCDSEAGKWYLISTPGTTISASQHINIREYDIKTLSYQDYTVANTTGEVLWGTIRHGGPDDLLNGRVYGGYIYMVQNVEPFQIYKIKLSDPSDVTEIQMYNYQNKFIVCQDAYAGRLYSFVSIKYNDSYAMVPGRVLNTQSNELLSIEAEGQYRYGRDQGGNTAPTAIPSLQEPMSPLYITVDNGSGDMGHIARTIRRNYLATINDLPSPVEKTADKTMKITYTLRRS